MNTYRLSFKSPAEILKYIKDNQVQYIDFNFTDLRGKWQHTTQHASTFDKSMIESGIFFDGSSIAGWRAINESDMRLKPDISRVTYDPFAAQKTIKVFCDVYEPTSGKPYNRDPRSVAKAAQNYMKSSGLADTAYFGPEIEFFVFDDIKVNIEMNHVGYHFDSEEGPYNAGKDYPTGNMGHRPDVKGGYFPESPVDSLSDIRAEMLTVLESMGVAVEKHHHEVAPSQCELGIVFSDLLDSADNVQLYKHAVHNVANSYGKSATFMPKPVFGDNGSGMHTHQSLWKGGKPVFAGEKYAGLSDNALYYIGGVMKHARALNAFTNPSTNSYKRLIPGFEAPVLLAYSSNNRSAACRIPYVDSPKGKRIEVRFPDPTANPYFSFAAMLMAGLDGIENKILPGDAMDKDLYEIPKEEKEKIPHVCSSLRQALMALEEDHKFLIKNDVFTEDLIKAYIALKMQDVERYESMTHPIEFRMYYSC